MRDLRFNYSKLKGKIIEKYGTHRMFAKALGISHASLSYKLTGKRQFDSQEIYRSAELLEIPLNEIASYFLTLKN